MKEFVLNTLGLKVLTPTGYQSFAGIAYMGDKPIWRLDFGNKRHLEATSDHVMICPHGLLEISEIRVGDWVYCGNGKRTRVKSKIDTGRVESVYELIEVENGHAYVANSVSCKQCEFVTDDETLINPLTLQRLSGVEPVYYTGQTRWFSEPLPNKTYMVALDPSLGTGGDYSAIEVFMLPDMIQVAEWQHNRTDPRNQVRVLMQTLRFIEDELRDNPEHHGEVDIFWTVENNSIGEAILQIIEDTGEDRFPGTFISEKKRKGQTRRFRKGLTTNNSKKLSACARMKSLVESGRMELRSKQLVRELKFFVRREASFGAKPGAHDDLTMSTLLIVRMLDVVLNWSSDVGDLREYIGEDELYESEPLPVVF